VVQELDDIFYAANLLLDGGHGNDPIDFPELELRRHRKGLALVL
jgi:hypothetical protein